MKKENFKKKFIELHDKNYKKLLLIPLILILFSFFYLISFYQNNDGNLFYKDISLTGGTSITLEEKIDASTLKNFLSGKLEDVNVREISDLITKEQKAIIIETKSNKEESKKILEEYLGYNLIDGENVSFEFTGSTLSENFYQQLLIALLIAFFLMAIVVFFQFRVFVPSLAVIFSAFADSLMTLVTINLLGVKLSSAGIVALIMLIGYSVDTDILLSNKVLKRSGSSLNKRLFDSFKTGATMTITSLVAVIIAYLIIGQFSSVLHQIFLIMAIGLSFDLLNTWITNVSIIKWYALEKRK
jgi:preprotein translocase subunit SecF